MTDTKKTDGQNDLAKAQKGQDPGHPLVTDPTAAFTPTAPQDFVPHEAVLKGGDVPLPKGHPVNPEGAIPRSPGEWPTSQNPPENPEGKVKMSDARPAGEPNAALNRTIAAKQPEDGVVPGSDEDKRIRDEAQKAEDAKHDKK
jgi:hypothetical protein